MASSYKYTARSSHALPNLPFRPSLALCDNPSSVLVLEWMELEQAPLAEGP